MTAADQPTVTLGLQVSFDFRDVLSRGYADLTEQDRWRKRQGHHDLRRKVWSSMRDRGVAEAFGPMPRTGVIVGARSLQNGTTEYEPDYGTVFAGDERVPVYLIATGMHDGFVRLRRADVTPQTEEGRA
ncbi:hypothetical protein [Cellulomonas taurus]|uniref:hypothetical protein n=1 Tax=Cellulomonas taurus TaxID=2729175 RepID=UPI00145CE7E3|nr:hypothetical protein [Cellulomonas taurus]